MEKTELKQQFELENGKDAGFKDEYIDWLESKLTSLPVSPNVSKVEDWDIVEALILKELETSKFSLQQDEYSTMAESIINKIKQHYSIPVSPTDEQLEDVLILFLIKHRKSKDELKVFDDIIKRIRSLFTPSERRVESQQLEEAENVIENIANANTEVLDALDLTQIAQVYLDSRNIDTPSKN